MKQFLKVWLLGTTFFLVGLLIFLGLFYICTEPFIRLFGEVPGLLIGGSLLIGLFFAMGNAIRKFPKRMNLPKDYFKFWNQK